jgi:hypothetical protein
VRKGTHLGSVEYIPLVVCTLGGIVLVFLYVFAFRLPSAQINMQNQQLLDELHADNTPNVQRATLILRSREPKAGELSALVVFVRDYERLDFAKQILPHAFEEYFSSDGQRILWRERWERADYDEVRKLSQQDFERKLKELQSEGWQIMLELPFSLIDNVVYLKKI